MSIKLETALESFYTFSGKLSDIVRQLSFAGIAVVWLFRVGGENSAGVTWNVFLLYPLGAFVLALALDLGQYTYYSAVWQLYHRNKEKEISELRRQNKEVPEFFYVNPKINWFGYCFFWGKTIFTIIGYFILLYFLWNSLKNPV